MDCPQRSDTEQGSSSTTLPEKNNMCLCPSDKRKALLCYHTSPVDFRTSKHALVSSKTNCRRSRTNSTPQALPHPTKVTSSARTRSKSSWLTVSLPARHDAAGHVTSGSRRRRADGRRTATVVSAPMTIRSRARLRGWTDASALNQTRSLAGHRKNTGNTWIDFSLSLAGRGPPARRAPRPKSTGLSGPPSLPRGQGRHHSSRQESGR